MNFTANCVFFKLYFFLAIFPVVMNWITDSRAEIRLIERARERERERVCIERGEYNTGVYTLKATKLLIVKNKKIISKLE